MIPMTTPKKEKKLKSPPRATLEITHEKSAFNEHEIATYGETVYWPERFNGKSFQNKTGNKDPSRDLPPEWAIWSEGEEFTIKNTEVKGWWEKHPLCSQYGYTPERAREIGISVNSAVYKLRLGKFFWSNQREFSKPNKPGYEKTNYSSFMEDIAVADLLLDNQRTSGRRFADFAQKLLSAEQAGLTLGTVTQLLNKIGNSQKKESLGPMPIDPRDRFLCYHWIAGEFLCLLSAKEILHLMEGYSEIVYNNANDVHRRISELGLQK